MAGQRTAPRKKKPSLAVREKWHRCLVLRQAGASWRDIAQQTGYQSAASAYNAAHQAMDEQITEASSEVVRLELDRLDRLHLAHWPNALRGDVPATQMIHAGMDRRARYRGLYAQAEGDDGQLGELVEALIELRRKTA